MERIHAQRTRRTIPTISVDKEKFVNVNPAAMDLVGMSPGDRVVVYWDPDQKIVAIEPREDGDYKLSARAEWGTIRSKPLAERLKNCRKGQYLATVGEHPNDPSRHLLQADLS